MTGFNEPEKCVDGVVLLIRLEREGWKVDIAGILLLRREGSGAGAGLGFLV